MINRRLSFIQIVLQLLALFLLTQTWYQISMNLEGKISPLGEFDAVSTYAIAMPVTLLNLTASLVALLVSDLGKRLIFGFSAVLGIAIATWISVQLFLKNVSGLDGQLDRLTGIAKTHGVEGLQVSATPNPWVWVIVVVAGAFVSAFLGFNKGSWQRQDTQARTTGSSSSTIDLWEQQRD